MKLTVSQLIAELSKKVDADLAKIVVESYVGMQNRFLIGDWKPSELDGGTLCEAVSRCLYQLDTGRLAKKSVSQVRDYLLDTKNNTFANFFQGKLCHHILWLSFSTHTIYRHDFTVFKLNLKLAKVLSIT